MTPFVSRARLAAAEPHGRLTASLLVSLLVSVLVSLLVSLLVVACGGSPPSVPEGEPAPTDHPSASFAERTESPLPPAEEPPAAHDGPATRVPKDGVTAIHALGAIGPGQNTLVIDLLPPEGGELTLGAPIVVEVMASGEGLRFPEPRRRAKIGEDAPPLRLPMEVAATGQGGVRLEVSYFWCTIDDAACVPSQLTLDVIFERGDGPGEALVAVQPLAR